MPDRRLPPSTRRRYLFVLIASGFVGGLSSPSTAQEAQLPIEVNAPASPTEMELAPPINSTLEIRVARRPWLLEKLTKPRHRAAPKTMPPQPPPALPQIPSLTEEVSPTATEDVSRQLTEDVSGQATEDGWVRRDGATPSADVPAYSGPMQMQAAPMLSASGRGDDSEIFESPLAERGWVSDLAADLQEDSAPPPANANLAPDNVASGQANSGQANSDQANSDRASDQAAEDPDHEADPSETEFSETERSGTDPMDATAETRRATPDLPLPAQPVDGPQPLRDPPGMFAEASESEPPEASAPDADRGTPGAAPPARRNNASTVSDEGFSDSEPDPEATAGAMVGDNTPAEGTGEADDLHDSRVDVRDLRIARDGSPVEEGDNEPEGDESYAAEADDIANVTPDASGGASQYVGTDPPGTAYEEVESPSLDYTGRETGPIETTATVARLQNSMRQCLRYYYARPEVVNGRSNWGMLHSIMVYGVDTKVLAGSRSYSAIAWIAGNNTCRGQKLLTEENGRIAVKSGVGLQGHQGQMLAVFSLCNVPDDYPLYAGRNKYSVRDVVEAEKLACKSGEELTFTLIGLSHYLDTNAVWQNADGETWDFERLIREELRQPVVGAACGGTHRLMGFAHALRKRRAEGLPITGQWKRAEIFTEDFVQYAYRLQNRDGSMSSQWFEGREDNGNLDRKIQTTGHVVEWLLTVTPDSELQDPRLVSAIRFLLAAMYNQRNHDWSIGPKGHALRSLAMYYERAYQSGPAWRTPEVARSPQASRR